MQGSNFSRGLPSCIFLAITFILLPIFEVNGEDSLLTPLRLATTKDRRRLSENMKVDLTVGGLKAEFKQLEPIPLEIVVKNVASTTARTIGGGYAPESEYRVVRIRIFDSKGNLLPETRWQSFNVKYGGYPIGGGLGSTGQGYEIAQDEEVRSDMTANLAYDMSSPGEYSIIAEFPTGEVREVDGSKIPVVAQSAVFKVRVLAEPNRLPVHMMRKKALNRGQN